jgi:hypothetical protein
LRVNADAGQVNCPILVDDDTFARPPLEDAAVAIRSPLRLIVGCRVLYESEARVVRAELRRQG